MKDEIKEILDNFKNYEDSYKKCNETQFIIFYRDIHLLLDYITNLQQIEQDHQKLNGELREENNKLNNIIDELKQKNNLAENILYDYLYNDGKITKEKYEQFKGLKEGK